MQKHPRCFEDSMRSDQMFAIVCSYAQCESVRQTVLAASIQNRKKDDSRETSEIASMRRSVLAELFTHSWRCISTCCVVQDILRRPALLSVASESRLTFSSQLRQSQKIRIEATLLQNRGDLPSVTLVEQALRDVCRFVSATQHACKVRTNFFEPTHARKTNEFQ